MDDFRIGDLAERRVNEVSGGQLQRACICRSLMMEPEIIFADEPTGALNQAAAADVIEAFLQINRKGTSIMMVTTTAGTPRCVIGSSIARSKAN